MILLRWNNNILVKREGLGKVAKLMGLIDK